MINCLNEGIVSKVHSDAKQCKEQWERPKRGENTGGLLILKKKGVVMQQSRKSKKRGREAVVLKEGVQTPTANSAVCHRHLHKENTVVVRPFCHVDKAGAEHSGWCSESASARCPFDMGTHPLSLITGWAERDRDSGCTRPIKTSN